jgi:hypothetical protein
LLSTLSLQISSITLHDFGFVVDAIPEYAFARARSPPSNHKKRVLSETTIGTTDRPS